jgi:hypothetical protein
MATAFDGLGMGQLGRENQYYSGSNPIREALKGLKDFAIVSGIQKSGLQDFLNKAGSKGDQAVPPPVSSAVPVNPAPMPAPSLASEVSAPVLQDANPIQKQADSAFGIQSSITPDTFKRDASQDMTVLQTTQAASPPPSNVGQGQMNKYGQGGGLDLATIASIAKFFI